MKDFRGRVAAITGAGSGIGHALAVQLAREGCHLALSDIDDAALADTVGRCEGRGVKVSATTIDVANRQAVEVWADRVVEEHDTVNLVFNNAGVALGASIDGVSYEDFEWLMSINFWGVVHGTKAFLPHLRRADAGHIVNLSSVFGLFAVPSQSAYNAAKFAVRGFTDALRMELEIERSHVSATTVHPGGIKTNIARSARIDESAAALMGGDTRSAAVEFEKLFMTPADKAAQQILTAVRRNRRRALIGPDAKALDLLSRLPASVMQKAIIGGARRR